MRRLVGAEVYEREVVPKLGEVCCVVRRKRRSKKRAETRPKKGGSSKPVEQRVYVQLTRAFFEGLAQHLPEPLRPHLVTTWKYLFCQLTLGCWDAVLLPKCVQWIARSCITIDMAYGLHEPYQTACLFHALAQLPGVTQLSLQWREAWKEGTMACPNLVSLTALTTALPKLVSLHISRLPLRLDMVSSLTCSSALQHLQLDSTLVCGLDIQVMGLQTHRRLSFTFPSQCPTVEQLREQRANEDEARRKNRQLRQQLFAVWEKAVRKCWEAVGRPQHLSDVLKVCTEAREQLQVEAARAGD